MVAREGNVYNWQNGIIDVDQVWALLQKYNKFEMLRYITCTYSNKLFLVLFSNIVTNKTIRNKIMFKYVKSLRYNQRMARVIVCNIKRVVVN